MILVLSTPAIAATYYVRASGDDARDGLTPETALASIRLAGRRLLAPGDRVIVGPGTYFEGNIEPYGSGTPDAPIAFSADESGLGTHDPPGPVIIRPPNTFDATTGFIVFGKHDIVIEGFTVEGARDPGIQVRPHFSTGADSTRVAIRNNTIRNGLQRGVHIVAAGDATVTDNAIVGNPRAGLAFFGAVSGTVRPFVSGNVIEGNDTAIQMERAFGVTISHNQLRENDRGIIIAESGGFVIRHNEILGERNRSISVSDGADIDISDNVFSRGVGVVALGAITFIRNRILAGGLGLYSGDGGSLRVRDNQLARVLIYNAEFLDFERNEGEALRSEGVLNLRIADNRFTRELEAFGVTTLELSRNRASRIDAGAASVIVTDNDAIRRVQVSANSGTVTGNAAELVKVLRKTADPDAGPLRVERNESRGVLQVGAPFAPVVTAVVQDNEVADGLVAFAEKELQIRRNDTSGITCGATASDSQLVVSDNTARRSAAAGIRVASAGDGLIEDNVCSGSEEFGLEVRQFGTLKITGNEFSSNEFGGVLVETTLSPAGDCDGDGRVTVAEVVTIVGITLAQRRLSECSAADLDGNELATLDELVDSVAAAVAIDPPDVAAGRVEIRSNRVEGNARFGINLFTRSALATGNRVVGNEGIALAVRSRGANGQVDIFGNLLGSGSGEGVLLKGTPGARVGNNVIFSNREAGILLRDAPGVLIVNNLIYDNGDDGIAVGRGTVLPASDAVLMNNSLYANRGWGVTIGTSGAPSTGTAMFNNIVDGNAQGGVASDLDSLGGLTIGFNLNNDGYSNEVAPSVTDFTADPRFVDPEGADELLGNDGFADDDFHLRGGDPASAAIDAGSATAAELGITGSAVEGLAVDEGIVDLGFHYGADAPSSRRIPRLSLHPIPDVAHAGVACRGDGASVAGPRIDQRRALADVAPASDRAAPHRRLRPSQGLLARGGKATEALAFVSVRFGL